MLPYSDHIYGCWVYGDWIYGGIIGLTFYDYDYTLCFK